MSVVLYTEFPCNITSHPYNIFCEGSGWGNEEATVACRSSLREQGYVGVNGIRGESIQFDHHHIEISPISCSWHGKCFA